MPALGFSTRLRLPIHSRMDPLRSRILVVDDNARNVAILRKILGRDYRVVTAGSGEEALRVAPRFLPDLTLLDIMMPGLDGYETCRRLRAMPETADSKIIMVSAKAMVSERLAGYKAGADDYLVKPFDDDELLAKVRVYLQLKSIEEVNRLKADVLTLINHETLTPLTLISGPLEIVLHDPKLPDSARSLLETAQAGAQRLAAFVESSTFLSRLYAGLVPFDIARHDLASMVGEAIAAVRPAAERGHVRLTESIPAGAEVECDPSLIRRVLDSILDNAIRHSPAQGAVEATLHTEEDQVRLTISDSGPGIPPELLPRLFEGFAVTDIAKHHSEGHGLSLAIARLILRRHAGTLEASNREQGGAEFVLRLPVPEPEKTAPRAAPLDAHGAAKP